MQLYLVRHAQSENNAAYDSGLKRYHHDPNLTEIGHKQADLLGNYLMDKQSWGVTHLYTSAMYRALKTAAPVSQALGLDPEVWIDIHEGGGLFLIDEITKAVQGFPGMNRKEILDQFPDYILPDLLADQGWWLPERGEEQYPDFAARVLRVVVDLRQRRQSNDVIMIVSHGAFLEYLIHAILGRMPTESGSWLYSFFNTSITHMTWTETTCRLRYLNRIEHLPEDLRT